MLHASLYLHQVKRLFMLVAAIAGSVEEGAVSLYSEEVGMWEYNLSGVGLKPGVMDPTHIAATLGSDGSSFVSWRNPFVDPVKVRLNPTRYMCQ